MAGAKDVTIRAQSLDGTWTVIGGDKARGLFPENVSLEADVWGSSRASFNLRRDPRAFFPDIGAFTPIEVEVGSKLVWSGRVSETPARVAQRVINVQCEGWQYHLDDDLYQRTYVHRRLADWKDAREFLGEDLNVFRTAGQINGSPGVVTLGWPNGAILPAGTQVGIKLDLGPDNRAASIALEVQGVTGAANSSGSIFIRGSATENYTASGSNDPFTATLATIGTNPNLYEGDFPFPGNSRYVTVGLYVPNAVTLTGDVMLQITGIAVVTDPGFIFAGSSVSKLQASTVVADALSKATGLLSNDTSGIQGTSFLIPEYAPGPQTPRQAWTSVDAYHDWTKKIDVRRRAVYQPKSTSPLFEVGPWSAVDDDDASANSGGEIYNRVLITGQTGYGEPFSLPLGLTNPVTDQAGIGQLSNSSADTNTAGWTVTSGTWTRDTFDFQSAPAAFQVSPNGSGVFDVWSSASADLQPLRRYRFTFWMLAAGLATDSASVTVTTTPSTRTYSKDFAAPLLSPSANPGWRQYSIEFIQPANVTDTGYTVHVIGRGLAFADVAIFDDFQFARVVTTVVDRRGFNRTMQLPISSALPADGVAAGQIGDVWLQSHKTTPFKGSVNLVGDASLRHITTGRNVGLEELLLNTTELLRFSDRTDPDTGGHGRDGRIAAVAYSPAANTATVTIDNSRTSFEALLARLAVIQGA
jgi:hypothetical protein